MVVNSSERKQALVGWFYDNTDYLSNLQLHMFLFFYECFSKIDNDVYELDGVMEDIECDEKFIATCREIFANHVDTVNKSRAKLSDFLVKTLGNNLTDFMCKLNIWAAKQKEIESGEPQVPLNEEDFSEQDIAIFRNIEQAYPESYIDSVETQNINGKAVISFKTDSDKLTDAVMDILNVASYDSDFESPVYISFSEMGELLLE